MGYPLKAHEAKSAEISRFSVHNGRNVTRCRASSTAVEPVPFRWHPAATASAPSTVPMSATPSVPAMLPSFSALVLLALVEPDLEGAASSSTDDIGDGLPSHVHREIQKIGLPDDMYECTTTSPPSAVQDLPSKVTSYWCTWKSLAVRLCGLYSQYLDLL
ncbi:hypothetical protein EJB05_22615, partial [Eragrostis curvula]